MPHYEINFIENMSTTETPASAIQVIDRMVSLLDAIAHNEGPVTLKFLAADTGLHPSTAFRILSALSQHRLVERDPRGGYLIGRKWLRYANAVEARVDVIAEAKPIMEALRDDVGETVNLTVREGDEVVYIERALPKRMMRVEQVIGSRAPLHVTAVGKLMLGLGGADAIAEYATRTGLPRYTTHTLTNAQDLQRAALNGVTRGYALDNEEAELGVGCIGVLVMDAFNNTVYGLSISAPIERRKDDWIALLMNAGRQVGDRLGMGR